MHKCTAYAIIYFVIVIQSAHGSYLTQTCLSSYFIAISHVEKSEKYISHHILLAWF